MRDVFINKLMQLAEINPKILLITGDLGFRVLDQFAKTFPRQYLNAGVAEQNMTGVAAGLALEGRTVLTYSIGNFPTLRCLEQIRNDICYHGADVKIVSIGGGFGYGSLGFSHHATEDLTIMRVLPEMTVVAPGDHWEAAEATEALIQTRGPAYLRLDKATAGETSRLGEKFELGKARKLREGSDMTLISTGGSLEVVLHSADLLEKKGIQCRVLSMHTLKPLDEQAVLDAAHETGGIVTVEEQSILGGLGGAVSEVCLEEGAIPRKFYRIGLREGFTTVVGNQQYLRQEYHINECFVVEKTMELLSQKAKKEKNKC